jgi:hypothetical protein
MTRPRRVPGARRGRPPLPDAERRTVPLVASVTESVHAAVRAAAAADGRTVQDWLRRLLDRTLARAGR